MAGAFHVLYGLYVLSGLLVGSMALVFWQNRALPLSQRWGIWKTTLANQAVLFCVLAPIYLLVNWFLNT